jgi:hypothetical protein
MANTFRPTLDVWTLSPDQIAALRPGQWVSAGPPSADRSNCGRFHGVRPSGSVVVAWNGNARRSGDWRAYQRTLHDFARAR